MDAKNLAGITEQLEKERGTLEAKAAKLRTELSGVESDLQKITAAISALTGNPASTVSKKTASKAKKGMKKAAGKADVIRLIRSVLADDAVLEEHQLRTQVEEALGQDGFSRLGFALRFKEALSDPQFVDSPGGYRIAESTAMVR